MVEFPRSSGLWLRPSALPGRFGMGEIGPEALRWLETLSRMGQSAWQLPLPNPGVLSGASLCQAAGDPLLLAFDLLRNDGALTPSDLALLPSFDEQRIQPGPVIEVREAFLKLAACRLITQTEHSPLLRHAFEKFCSHEAAWLEDWALFAVLRHLHEGRPWPEWPRELATRDPVALAQAREDYAGEIAEQKALQFMFHRQWRLVRGYAHDLGICLIGEFDAWPMLDSVEVWRSPELFQVSSEGRPMVLADGAPAGHVPCCWEEHRRQGFAWWRGRLRAALMFADVLCVRGFAGFAGYRERSAPDAEGCWVHVPGDEIMTMIKNDLGSAPAIFADPSGEEEDTREARALIERHGLASLLPAAEDLPAHAAVMAGGADWAGMEQLWPGKPRLVLATLPQLLELPDEEDDACWRFHWDQITPEKQLRLRTLTAKAGRL